jgi:hypothetical protein
MNIKIYVLNENILHLKFENIRDQTVMLFRPSEYYESPHDNINGKIFSFEDFFLTYVKPNGEMTYFKDWPAFNIPGHTLTDFRKKFKTLTESEKNLYKLLDDNLNIKKPYYVISNLIGDKVSYKHELAHALYYLIDEYKLAMDEELKNIPKNILKKLYRGLKNIGYPMNIQHIVDDEAQSWLATSTKKDFDIEFNFTTEEIGEVHKVFKKIFTKYEKQIESKEIC